MKTFQIVSVKDELTGSFLAPQFIATKEEALRVFTYQINNTPIWKDNPEDFSLYALGTFDQETGTVIGINPTKVAGGRSVWKEKE